MAGAIDIHSHIAGGNVNNARLLSPEIHSNFLKQNLKEKNLPGFNSRWTSDGTGYRYAEMGFTTVVEPAVLPINSFLTHLELEKIPMIDKAGLAILGNDSFLLESMHKKKGQNFLNDYVAYTLNSTKCLGLKVINAGGAEFFKKGGETFDLDDVVPSYGVTSRQILTALNKANEDLKIKHPLMYIVITWECQEILKQFSKQLKLQRVEECIWHTSNFMDMIMKVREVFHRDLFNLLMQLTKTTI